MSSRGQTCNEVIDAANGDGDAADDPASAGGEVASGVAALAVRYGKIEKLPLRQQQRLVKAVCEAGYWAVLIVLVNLGFLMASCGLPGVRRGRRRDAVNDPSALDDEDPTQGARQRKFNP